MYNPSTIQFLEDAGHVLEEHTSNGVMRNAVADWVRSNLQTLSAATWVMFQGDCDAAFLLRSFALDQYLLPGNRSDFLRTVRATIPVYFDVRVLGLHLLRKDPRGFSLTSLGTCLGIRRHGEAHGSASDALLTVDCFIHIRRNLGSQIRPLLGVLCGLYSTEAVVRSALPLYADDLKQINVWKYNFEEYSASVLSSADTNFNTIGLHADFSRGYMKVEDSEYNNFRTSVHGIVTSIISVAMANTDGQLAGGQAYRFHISFEDNPSETFIPADMFAAVVLKSLLTHQSSTWVTFQGAESVACLYRCDRALPPTADQYFDSRSCMFSCLYDLAFLTEPGKNTLHELCKGHSVKLENNMGEQEDEAVLILRLFLQVIQSGDHALLEENRGCLLCQLWEPAAVSTVGAGTESSKADAQPTASSSQTINEKTGADPVPDAAPSAASSATPSAAE